MDGRDTLQERLRLLDGCVSDLRGLQDGDFEAFAQTIVRYLETKAGSTPQ